MCDSSRKVHASEGLGEPWCLCLHDTIPLLSAWVVVPVHNRTLSLSWAQ